MGTILVVENNRADVALVEARLRDHLGEEREIQAHYAEPGRTVLGVEDLDLTDVDLVLVDFELSETSDEPPGDPFGRDIVLPYLRKHARWIPVILVSRYLGNDGLLVAETSPFGFDGLLPKVVLNNSAFARPDWHDLVRRSALNRIAALTGRDLFSLEDALRDNLELRYGATVRRQIMTLGEETLEKLLKLAGFAGGRVAIEHMEQGYSGSVVMRAVCRRGTREANWLLKVTTEKEKLDTELARHRLVQVDGVTRRVTVPPLWMAPIVWGAGALIAYEFEPESRTLLDFILEEGTADGLAKVREALRALYEGCVVETVVPADALRQFVSIPDPPRRLPRTSALRAFLERRECEELDRTTRILVGCHHGDLHSRNILVSDSGVALIDFAHYAAHSLGRGESGIPLLDLAKLAVDLWINQAGPGPAVLLSGDVLTSPHFAGVADLFLSGGTPTAEETRFFVVAVECLLGKYLSYPNLPQPVRRRIRSALRVRYG